MKVTYAHPGQSGQSGQSDRLAQLSTPNEYVEVSSYPVDAPGAPVVIIWPALGAPAQFYRHLTPTLNAAGLSCLVVEYPGRDTADGVTRATKYGYDTLATQVHEAVMRHARGLHPLARGIFLLGHSLGGQVSSMASAVATDPKTQPDGVILAASASPYWRGYERNGFARSYLGTATMASVARLVGYWPGDALKFWGRQSATLINDWSRWARTGHIRPSGAATDYEAAMRRFRGQILAISLPNDPLAPQSALEVLLSMMPNAEIERYHAKNRAGHVQWVRRHDEVAPVIIDWIRQREGIQRQSRDLESTSVVSSDVASNGAESSGVA